VLVVWGNGAIAISLDFRALFCYSDYFIVIGGLASVIGINLNIYIAEMYLQISSVSGRWCVRLGLAWAIVGSAVAFGSTALAQVVPDNTVGSAVSGVGDEQTITGGTRQGGNLFHSFERFSVPTNGAAIFRNDLDIQNILSRVTGGSVSDIDGLIQANGAANLFLLNPNGIIFGQNARLDVGGSFIATTASSINFADGTQFSATPGTGAPLLTVSVPLGLQFGAGAGEIVNRSRAVDSSNFVVGLQVQSGKTLGLIGGNVNMEGGWLTARGGRVELGAVAAPGVVGINPDNSGFRFNFPTDLTLGDISLTNASVVNVAADRGGSIATNSQNLSLEQSYMQAGIRSGFGSPDSKAGNIDINARGRIALADESFVANLVQSGAIGNSGDLNVTTETLVLTGGSQLSTGTFAQGNPGNIHINASDITFSGVSDGFTSGVLSNVEAGANGTGGIINIKADSMSLIDGAQIQAILRGSSDELRGAEGSGGKVDIEVRDSFNVSGSSNDGRFSSTVSTTVGSGAKGKGGDINIKVGTLDLSDGARLRTDTLGTGDAGNVTIAVNDRISLDNSRIFSSVEEGGKGRGGNVDIKARSLSLTNNSRLNAGTSGQGNAGNIFLRIDDSASFSNSYIFSSVAAGAMGDGGNVDIKAGSLFLTDGAQIVAQLESSEDEVVGGRGNGGRVKIDVRDTFSVGGFPSGIFTIVNTGAEGKGGDIEIKARSLDLNNEGYISSDTYGQGDAGSISITTDERVFLGGSSQVSSTVSSTGVGKGGDINIKARSLELTNGSFLNATTFSQENAGNINIDVSDTVILDRADGSGTGIFNNTENQQGGTSKGGRIDIKTGSLFLRNGAVVSASTLGQGDAGSVTITAGDRVSLDNNSVIFSSVGENAMGNGGNVTINAQSLFLVNGSYITASTFGRGDAGNIIVDVSTANFVGQDVKSGIFSTVEANSKGNGGDISLTIDTLLLKDGAQINVNSLGDGDAGDITVDARDWITIDGVGSESSGGIFSGVEGGTGSGGNLNVTTGSLELKNGGVISSSIFSGEKNAGNISITASDKILIDGVGNLGLSSGIFNTSEDLAKGNGGDITIEARSLSITNGAQVNASNFGQGNAGNIDIGVHALDLNDGRIFAESTSGNSGDIRLQASKSVRLRNGSLISTSTGSGNGGNITINSPLVIAEFQGNNDIFANAFDGEGGEIKINAQSIFGLKQRTSEELQPELQRRFGTATPTTLQLQEFLGGLADNDVAAISLNNPSLSGTVTFNAADIDPSRDIVELPTGLVDASSLVAAGCPSGAENRFTVAGRGGLPPAPGDKLSSDALLTDWATLQTPETENRAAVATTTPVATNTTPIPPVETITEATSWQYDRNGAIILTSGDTTSPSHLKETLTSCPSS
jgi:filamentous hemagglutinin family protein